MTENEFKSVVVATMHYVRCNRNASSIPNNKTWDEVRKLLPEFSDNIKIEEDKV